MKPKLKQAYSKLTPEQYNVCFLKGTEPPGSGKFLHNKAKGIYVCAVCGQKLFASDTKFDSGTGWPSFWDTASSAIKKNGAEVTCANCGSHLGHVFNDGPRDKTGLRYCINSLALDFKSNKQ